MSTNNKQIYFSFEHYASALKEIIEEQDRGNSFVIAVTGTWGSGKTTLLDLTLNSLDETKFIKVNFNAWRYTREDAVWRGFFISILSTFRKQLADEKYLEMIKWGEKERELCLRLIDETEQSLYSAFVREVPGEVSIDTSNLAQTGLKLALKFVPWGNFGSDIMEKIFQKKDKDGRAVSGNFEAQDIDQLWGIFKRSVVKRQIEKLTSMEQFRTSMERLISAVLCGTYPEAGKQGELKPIENPLQLVVAVDDLDRCLPEQALEIFEAIKLFLDLPRSYFVVAMDQDVIQQALNLRYKQGLLDNPQIRAEQYTEKMIDLTFSVPSAMEANFKKLVKEMLPGGSGLVPLYETLKIALPLNVRSWERFATKADFNKKIIKRIFSTSGNSLSLPPEVDAMYMKLQCLAYQWPEVYRKIGSLEVYAQLEKCALEAPLEKFVKERGADIAAFVFSNSSNAEQVPARVWKVIIDVNLIQFIRGMPLIKNVVDKKLLRVMFSLDKEAIEAENATIKLGTETGSGRD